MKHSNIALSALAATSGLYLSVVACAGEPAPATGSAVPVEIVEIDGTYRLLRGGEPYEIKGAGIEYGNVEALVAHGGNSLRTWRTDTDRATGQQVLDRAAALGVTVLMTIEIGRERHGFDYDDEQAVAAQLEYARGEVLKYRDHPALLAWSIGNEANLSFKNPKVFDAINAIAKMIHELDPHHPVTTALAGFDARLAELIRTRAPDLDFVSIQMYGDIVNLPRYLDEARWEEPYFVTEWGATGHWEVAKTRWGAPIEQNSSEKAASYLRAYETAIAADPARAMGSYVFLWGQKQERTPTWYGMFLADGSETEVIDVMHYIWNGAWPANRSPRVEGLLLDGRTANQDIALDAGVRYAASVIAEDPDGDPLDYRWAVMRESEATQEGG
ncbi:MAG: glycoside hydrolase family 2 TIM barrel-domain containing protein, partial [Lysobacterales bacterium]